MEGNLSAYEPDFITHMVSVDEKLERYTISMLSKEEKSSYIREISRDINEAERYLRQMEIEVSILPTSSKAEM
jgi:hypothetical protein